MAKSMWLNRIRSWLRFSKHFHLRENPASDLRSLVDLIDRFLDGPMNYPLEWDDFISWQNENKNIETIRERISLLEPLFFSSNMAERRKAEALLVIERNQIAALIGLPALKHAPHSFPQ